MWSAYNTKSEMLVFTEEPRIRFYTRTRKFKNEVTNRRGKKGPFLNLKKSCIINGLTAALEDIRFMSDWNLYDSRGATKN